MKDRFEMQVERQPFQLAFKDGLIPGTFIGITTTSKEDAEFYSYFVRETNFGEWKRVRGIVSATVLLSNQ